MRRYIVRRLVVAVPVLVVVSMITFLLLHLAPGDPLEQLVPYQARGPGSEEYIERARRDLGLDKPLPLQYVTWVREILSGNLGYSYGSGRPVSVMLGERVGPTLLLMGSALLLSLFVAVPLGVAAALRHNSLLDRAVSAAAMTAISIPSFFLGLVAIKIFALDLRVLPSAGMSTGGGVVDALRHLVLPASVLSALLVGPYMRFTRQAMLDTLNEDFMQTARAMGIKAWRRNFVHALRNALIPLVTIVFVQLPLFIGGTVIIEQIFAWPGMGRLLVTSTFSQDYPPILAFALLTAVAVLIANLISDIVASMLDPRIRHA